MTLLPRVPERFKRRFSDFRQISDGRPGGPRAGMKMMGSGPSRHGPEGGRDMCRNIKTLFNFEPPATDAEVQAAALQFVRKVSGFTKPSSANQRAFDQAVRAVT